MTAAGQGPSAPRQTTVRQGDRDKAYRPLPEADRRDAFEAALQAYAQGDFFETHELLEPAWMGTDDLAERALHQGLIKLAAAYVHAVRGNPQGLVRNLEGARRHLALAGPSAAAWGVDVAGLVTEIDVRLAATTAHATGAATAAPPDPLTDPGAAAPAIRRTQRA